MRRPSVLYDFAPDPIWMSLTMRKISFLFYHCTSHGNIEKQAPLEGVSPLHRNFFVLKWHWLRSLPFRCPKKSRFSGPTPSNGPINGFARTKIIRFPCRKNNRYIGSSFLSFVSWAECRAKQRNAGKSRLNESTLFFCHGCEPVLNSTRVPSLHVNTGNTGVLAYTRCMNKTWVRRKMFITKENAPKSIEQLLSTLSAPSHALPLGVKLL